jgi:methyl-accepting chemotaxis protein
MTEIADPNVTPTPLPTSADTLTRDRDLLVPLESATTRALAVCKELDEYSRAAAANNDDIEKGRIYVNKARATIDALLGAAEGSAHGAEGHAEKLKGTLDEANTLLAAANTANTQARETSAQAGGALEHLKSALGSASEGVVRIETLPVGVKIVVA